MKEGNYVRCDECDKNISRKHLKEHVKSIHLKIKDYSCEQCPSMYATKSLLKQHLLRHKDEKNFKCKVCDKTFKMKRALNVHSNIHTKERSYICDDCGKSFTDPSYFGRHKKEQHSEINAFECKVCPQTFRTHLRLKKHLKTHSSKPEVKTKQEEKPQGIPKRYDDHEPSCTSTSTITLSKKQLQCTPWYNFKKLSRLSLVYNSSSLRN